MDMNRSYDIPAPRNIVWAALNEEEVLKACISGCESITRHSDTELHAVVSAKVGPVKAKFTGTVTLSDIDPPNGYTITGEGKGGAAGFAKGGARVWLEDSNGGTTLSYSVNASVGGKLAQIGSRLIDSTAKKMADDFFAKFSDEAVSRASGETKPSQKKNYEGNAHQEATFRAAEPKPEQAQGSGLPSASSSAWIWLATLLGLFALGAIWLMVS